MSIKFSMLPQATLPLNGDEILCVVQDGISKQVAAGDVSGATADPTALVGLLPVAGVAATLMRSDAAPALDQAIMPVWTGSHEFQAPVLFTWPYDNEDPPLAIRSSNPVLELDDTDQAADAARWHFTLASDGTPYMALRLVSGSGVVQSTPLRLDRATGNVSGITWEAAQAAETHSVLQFEVATGLEPVSRLLIDDNGAWSVEGETGVSGQVLRSRGGVLSPEWGDVMIGAEAEVILAAGTTNNVAVTAQRLLLDTSAGPATVTGFVAQTDGTLILVTNFGNNDLTLAIETGSAGPNQLFGPADLTVLPGGSKWLCYSGNIGEWVIVS